MASISFRNVVKRYGQGSKAVQVIHGLSAQVEHGEFVVIVGPSGCGKSTLLRMVAGLEPITSGEIAIGDRVVNDIPPNQRNIAMVFQNYALYPHMSVFDNMAYGLKISKVPVEQITERVNKVARILELGHLLQRKPKELSGGQRQRVAMGRAIVREPQVFLFDEPLSNLDAKLRAQTRLEIQKLHQDLGITSLFVTHDQVEAMTLAQRMIVLNGGHLEQFGSPEEVYQRPASTFVAGFIGSPPMNLLPGRLVNSDTGPVWDSDLIKIPLDASILPQMPQHAKVLGIRPEHLTLAPSLSDSHFPTHSTFAHEPDLQVKAEMVELLGAERLVYLASNASTPLVVKLNESHPDVRAGQMIQLKPRMDRLHWFDDKGCRIAS